MKQIAKLILICSMLIGMALTPVFSQTNTAKEVVQKAQDKVNGLSSKGGMKMIIERPGWSREITMKSWSLGTDFYMIYITGPARDKGQVFMKRHNDMWNWMPNISRMIKIPPSMMSQSWMGSDFTNDDLVKMNSLVEDYDHTFNGEEIIEDLSCYIIDFIPKEEAAVVWGKITMWISKEDFYELKAEYYDEDLEMVNIMTASDITFMGDRYLPAKMEMIPVDEEGHKTRMVMHDFEFNIDIQESFFSQQNMKKVR